MILDLSMIFGIADMHDRYRDMRLDVDNMSYEVKPVAIYCSKKFPFSFQKTVLIRLDLNTRSYWLSKNRWGMLAQD